MTESLDPNNLESGSQNIENQESNSTNFNQGVTQKSSTMTEPKQNSEQNYTQSLGQNLEQNTEQRQASPSLSEPNQNNDRSVTLTPTDSTQAISEELAVKDLAPETDNLAETASQTITEESIPQETEVVAPTNAPTQNTTQLSANRPKSSKLPLFLSVIALACSLYSLNSSKDFFNFNANKNQASFSKDSNSANFTEGSIASVASSVAKSVVSIITSTNQKSFFSSENTTQTAAGTGFILSSDGYIATNKHVVSGAHKVGVVLDDGTTYEDVELVGVDPLNDFAIIKIKNVKDLTPIKLGNSKTTTTGQQVIAIGYALGAYQNSVTSGIISGKGRSVTASDSSRTQYENLSDMIQTDAAINGGNSGGPLVNAAGEVIGINTAYASQGNNVGFAIPISSVKGIIKNVLAGKGFERAVIGVRYSSITPDKAKEKELPVNQGALISSGNNGTAIIPGSAGDKAGLKENDIITHVNDTQIGNAGSLSSLIGEYSVGETINLTILRDGKPQTLKITLTAYKQ